MIQKRQEPIVILVEGDPVVVSTLRKALQDEPFELRATANPLRALKWLEESDARLLLANPDMPAVQASHLIRMVEERFPGTTCALLSADPGDASERTPHVATKPWDSDRFERAVLDLLHREAASPRVAPLTRDEQKESAVFAQGMTVLLVHARMDAPSPVEIALRDVGFAPLVAPSAHEALEMLREAPLGTDFVLLPPQLSGTSGAALIREMLRVSPGLTVILQPGEWTRQEILAAYQAGAQNLVTEGESPQRVADLLLRSARIARERRLSALRRIEETSRRTTAPWHRRALRFGRSIASAPGDSRMARVRRMVLVSAAGLLLGTGLAWTVDAIVGGPAPATSVSDRLLGTLERALAKDPFHESDFQKWYLLQRLSMERQAQQSTRQSVEEQMQLQRMDALFRDVRAEDASLRNPPAGQTR